MSYPGTAITSPYDYVTTVVFPHCAAKGAASKCVALTWDEDCANQSCYGVPLYRENLLTGESATPIRLMGQSKFQRSSLTTNNNTYYIDTTPSQKAQLNPPGLNPGISHLNVFEKNKTYYVFLLFAKATTKQTYDLYVGKGFDETDPAQLFLTRVKLPGDYIFDNAGKLPAGWTVKYDKGSGVLSVTMDMSKVAAFPTEYAAARKGQCQPTTFCKWDGNAPSGEDKCQCADNVFSPPSPTFVSNECTKTDGICSWAVKDVDCPEGGCYGFGVKMSGQFVTSDSPPSPAPTTQCFPKTTTTPKFDSPWDISFTGITDTSDKCFYPSLPTAQFCP